MPTQAPEWIDSLCANGVYRNATRLYEMPDGRQAILPLVQRTGVVGGRARLESMPTSWGYGGLIAPDGVTAGLAGAVLDDLQRPLVGRVVLRPNPLHAAAWAEAAAGRRWVTEVPRRAHVLDLAGGFDVAWRERFRSPTRTKVRRAQRLGVVVRTGTAGELLGVFHDLLLRSFDRWAEQQHEPHWLARLRGRRRDPAEKFHTIAARLGERFRVSVAWYGGEPAAAILVLRNANVAHYTRGAMDKPLAAACFANYLLHKVAVEDACKNGCQTYHMGESGTAIGLSQFKGHFGAMCRPYAEYKIEHVPLSRMEHFAKKSVKRAIGFRDV
jgi:hypothetical protein